MLQAERIFRIKALAWISAAAPQLPLVKSETPSSTHRPNLSFWRTGQNSWLASAKPVGVEAPSVYPKEVTKFSKMASEWWDQSGPLQPLHAMNPTRCKFIRDFACLHFGLDKSKKDVMHGLRVLDIGCGGGILSESMGRMGADVLGIDVAEESIMVARDHLQHDHNLQRRVRYKATSAEALAEADEVFDVVLASEVIEHVKDPRALGALIGRLVKPKGIAIMSTLNRTPQSYVLAILAAEYVLQLVPKGTHKWRMFLTPDELVMITEAGGLKLSHLAGLSYNFPTSSWALRGDVSINYIAAFTKDSND